MTLSPPRPQVLCGLQGDRPQDLPVTYHFFTASRSFATVPASVPAVVLCWIVAARQASAACINRAFPSAVRIHEHQQPASSNNAAYSETRRCPPPVMPAQREVPCRGVAWYSFSQALAPGSIRGSRMATLANAPGCRRRGYLKVWRRGNVDRVGQVFLRVRFKIFKFYDIEYVY